MQQMGSQVAGAVSSATRALARMKDEKEELGKRNIMLQESLAVR